MKLQLMYSNLVYLPVSRNRPMRNMAINFLVAGREAPHIAESPASCYFLSLESIFSSAVGEY
jgi:hypothetical protein